MGEKSNDRSVTDKSIRSMFKQQDENPYGEQCDTDLAPEMITKMVTSLPPEQMYEMMKQMKKCIQNNPSGAREMLLLNPQLTYAILQAQVVMRIVDPQTAVSVLFKSNPQSTSNASQNMGSMPQPVPPVMASHFPTIGQDVDLRNSDPRLNRSMDMDMRSMTAGSSSGPMDPGYLRPSQSQSMVQRPAAPFRTDPRHRADPRIKSQPPQMTAAQVLANSRFPAEIPNDDQEKTALILQVLQLADEQVAMLPPEQRASIMILKEQIAKTAQR